MKGILGYHRKPFTIEQWNRWLDDLNRKPHPELVQGIKDMRWLLQNRCMGVVMDDTDTTAAYRAFVEKQFGTVR